MDVGVLDLQIRDNSNEAYTGLNNLATALERVQKAVGSGIRLSGIARQIEEINRAVATAIPDKSITNLERLADVIQKINAAGGIKLTGLKKAIQDMDAAQTAQQAGRQIEDAFAGSFSRAESRAVEFAENVGRAVGNAADEAIARAFNPDFGSGFFKKFNPETGMFENMPGIRSMKDFVQYSESEAGTVEQMANAAANAANSAERMRDLIKETGWQAGNTAEAFAQMFQYWSAIRSSRALGPGDNEYYERMRMKAEAIPAEGSVSGDFKRLAAGITDAGNAAPEATAQLKGLDSELRQKKTDAMGAADGISRFNYCIGEASSSVGSLRGMFGTLGEEFANLKAGIHTLLAPITNLVKQFWRLAKMRMMRYIIRQIAQGFSEGVQNVYHYSKAIGSQFAPAMDSAASALQKFKNSVGAAVAPLIQALIPAINSVISAVIRALNVLNQFFALITGQSSWTMAVDTAAEAWADTANSTGSAANNIKEAKDLLADWDELNIIQSDVGDTGGGGGGGGGKKQQDYSKMFETINKFNEKLKKLVDYINEKFGSVWGMVKEIGAALLAWKVSAAFAGIVGQLAAIAGTIITLDLIFKITSILDNMFFDTGEQGYLIANILETLLGTYIAGNLIKKVLGEGAGAYGISIALTVSALADMITTWGRVDVSALDPKALEVLALAAIKGGAAAGFLMYGMGYGTSASLAGGAASALLTFSVGIGVKAVLQAIESGVTEETLKASAMSSLFAGLGVGLLLKTLVPTMGLGKLFGWGAASALAVLGVTIGIQATVEAIESGITDKVIELTAISSMSMGLTGTLIAKMLGTGLLTAVGYGAAAAIATVGVVVGVQATVRAIKGGVTDETIQQAALSSVSLGLSAGMIAKLLGASALAATGYGLLAAALAVGTITAVIAIETALNSNGIIRWGDNPLTEEEIQAFVNQFMLNKSFDLPATLELIAENVQVKKGFEDDLRAQTADMGVLVNTIVLGVADEETYQNLDKAVNGEGGFVDTFIQRNKATKKQMEIAFAIVPAMDENGENISGEFLATMTEGWGMLNSAMTTLGNELSDALKTAYNKKSETNARDMAMQTITDITQAMADMTAITTSTDVELKIAANVKAGLKGVDKGSIAGIISFYDSQVAIIDDMVTSAYEEPLGEALKLIRLYEYNAEQAEKHEGKWAGFTTEQWENQLEAQRAAYAALEAAQERSKEAAMDYYTNGEGFEMIRDYIISAMEGRKITAMNGGLAMEDLRSYLVDSAGNLVENADAHMDDIINAALAANFDEEEIDIIQRLLDMGMITYGDIFGEDFATNVAKSLGISGEQQEAVAAAINNALAAGRPVNVDTSGIEESTEEAVRDTIEEAVENAASDPVDVEDPLKVRIDSFDLEAAKGKDIDLLSTLFRSGDGGMRLRQQLIKSGSLTENASEVMRSVMDSAIQDAFGQDYDVIEELLRNGKLSLGDLFSMESGEELADQMGLSGGLREAFLGMFSELLSGNGTTESYTGVPEAVRSDLDAVDQAVTEHQTPAIDPPNTTEFDNGISSLKDRTVAACADIRSAVLSLSGLGASFSASFNANVDPYYHYPMSSGGSAGGINKPTLRATGGFIRSGDLVMANENGNIEYMGKMGSNPAIANNEQIVEGISRGVSQSNGDLVSAMNTLIGIARQMASKEMTAKVVPSASMGRSNRQSELAYSKISG